MLRSLRIGHFLQIRSRFFFVRFLPTLGERVAINTINSILGLSPAFKLKALCKNPLFLVAADRNWTAGKEGHVVIDQLVEHRV